MEVGWNTWSQTPEVISKESRFSFYREVLQDIKIDVDSKDISTIFSSSLPLWEELMKNLELSLSWEYIKWEAPLIIVDGKFYIYGDEFTHEEIESIICSYYWEDDIDFLINLSTDGLARDDEDIPHAMSNFITTITSVPSLALKQVGQKFSWLVHWLLHHQNEQRYIEKLEFIVQDMHRFLNKKRSNWIQELMHDSQVGLSLKLAHLAPYNGWLDITINPDKTVSSADVTFTQSEWSIITAYYYSYNESYDV